MIIQMNELHGINITIPPSHHVHYRMNPNYVAVIKQDFDELLAAGFIKSMEQAIWLSPIVVVPNKNTNCTYALIFWKLNATTKKDPYQLPFTNEVLDKVISHEVYLFLDGFFGYHQIQIALKDHYKTTFIMDWGVFVWVVMPFGLKNVLPTYPRTVSTSFKDYLDDFMKLFLDDFTVFSDLHTHLSKIWRCFEKC
jgi:hypothetical protein